MMVFGAARVHPNAGSMRVGGGVCGHAGSGWRRAATMAMLAGWLALSAGTAFARDPVPEIRVLAPDFLLGGSSMLTVDFVDKDHLLVTFGVRRLMTREVDPPPDDDDRVVGAFLVELPSGKVLTQTEWRFHDRGRYLWNLGQGRFLLRVRDQLTVIAPMRAAKADDAFDQYPLLRVERHIVAILVSPNDDLLTVETTQRAKVAGQDVTVSLGDATIPDPVQINFYRLRGMGSGADGLQIEDAGAVHARDAIAVPMTSAGILDVLEGGKGRWLFNFDEDTGKVNELAEYDTSCFPHTTFVGHSEFIAFGCRGSDDKLELAAFNLKGEEMWQQSFIDEQTAPTFAFAPAAGRFALGRIVTTGALYPQSPLTTSVVNAQEVRVYQSYNGKQLLHIDCTPAERAGQNFALSPDGMRLAVVRETMVHHAATKDYAAYNSTDTAVEVYAMPVLSDKDQMEVKRAEASAPVESDARIDLELQRIGAATAKELAKAAGGAGGGLSVTSEQSAVADAGSSAASGSDASSKAAASPQGEAESQATEVVEGDVQPSGPRKPPTLYGPDEKQPEKPQ